MKSHDSRVFKRIKSIMSLSKNPVREIPLMAMCELKIWESAVFFVLACCVINHTLLYVLTGHKG